MKRSALTSSQYNPYYKNYIDLVPDVSLDLALASGKSKIISFFNSLPESKLKYRYAKEKWTPKDILQHLIDSERVFAYRALYFSRFSRANLEGFDENVFAENTYANNRPLNDLLEEYEAVRNASLCLFKSFDEISLTRNGIANGSSMAVAAAGFVICGHEIHHCNIINQRYL